MPRRRLRSGPSRPSTPACAVRKATRAQATCMVHSGRPRLARVTRNQSCPTHSKMFSWSARVAAG
eukprot:3563159-Lingulodinium_polyedra.AAC.1